jgi:hypothetical protein
MSWAIIPEFRLPDEPEALTYIAAVEAADGQALEPAVKLAINAFIKGCKNDGIWPAIKASCILAGARTLEGALVPLVGPAPTNNNFAVGDYNRETGLVGDGSTKQINSGYAGSALLLNNHHLSVYATTVAETTGGRTYIGESTTSASVLLYRSGNVIMRSASSSVVSTGLSATATGLIGFSRSSSSSFTGRAGSANATINDASVAIGSNNIFTHSRGGSLYSSARLAFYSIGESLDLALLDVRVTDLINAFGAAIP